MKTLQLRRRQLLAAVALGQVLPRAQAQAANWPSRPVRFVTQAGPGDPVDLRLREILRSLMPMLGDVVAIVDNRPGAGGLLGHQAVLNSPADGYTVLLTNATMTIFPTLYRKLTYSPLRDFIPVAFSGQAPIALAIPAARPEKTFKDWLAWARTQKGTLNYGSPGSGSVSHLYGFQLNEQFGLEATPVPYKGALPSLMDLVAGQVHFTMQDAFTLRPWLQRGDLRVLAITGEERSKFLPDSPTFRELGHAGYERMGWSAYYMKAGTPTAIVEQLAKAINTLNGTPEWEAKRDQQWTEWRPKAPAAMAEQVRAETEAWAVTIRKTGYYAD
jgi:tripartite-type tricarboxylate transporter receptor subunit TctC